MSNHRGGHWRALGRWETPFARAIDSLGGAARVAKLLSDRQPEVPVKPVSVYNWIAGFHYPRPVYARALVALATEASLSLTVDQVYQHRDTVSSLRGLQRAASAPDARRGRRVKP